MSPTSQDLLQWAMALPEAERMDLVEQLLESVSSNEDRTAESIALHPAWDAEIVRRVANLDRGKSRLTPWDEVNQAAAEIIHRAEANRRQ